MRRENISVLLAVPVANALSLANFQSITSILIPISCQLTYDGQIPSCTVSDFNNGCSAACVGGLNAIAKSVSKSCDDVEVNSNTLLGIVKNGGIVAALCPTLAKTSTKATISVTVQSSTLAPQPAAVSVTIPTDSAGVTGGLGFKTGSTTTTSTPIPVPQSEISTKTTSAAKTTKTSSTTSQSVQSADGGLGGGSPATTSTQTTAKKTISSASAQTTSSQQSQDKSGGGSPFDTQASNDATRDVGRSMLALVVAMFAVMVIGR